jgi:hypothetical protein
LASPDTFVDEICRAARAALVTAARGGGDTAPHQPATSLVFALFELGTLSTPPRLAPVASVLSLLQILLAHESLRPACADKAILTALDAAGAAVHKYVEVGDDTPPPGCRLVCDWVSLYSAVR